MLILEDVIGPPAELIGYLVLPAAALLGLLDPLVALAFLALTVLFGTALSFGTLALEEAQLRRSPTATDLARIGAAAFVENFGFRQINMLYRWMGIRRHFQKDTSWAAVPRVGFNNG